MELEEIILLPEGPAREPRGRLLVDGREVGVFRSEEERSALISHLEEISLSE